MTEATRRTRRRTRRRRPLVRLLVALLIAAVVLGGAGAAVAWMLSRSTPEWWTPLDASDEDLHLRADLVENRVVTQATRVDGRPIDPSAGGSEPWTVSITQREATAWANARLADWVRERAGAGAGDVPGVRVRFEGVQVLAGLGLGGEGGAGSPDSVLWARVSLRFDEDGRLWAQTEDAGLGRLPLPASWALGDGDSAQGVLPDLPPDAAPAVQAVVDTLRGRRPIETRLKLPDGRWVRVTGVSAGEDEAGDAALLVTCRTYAERPGEE